MDERRFATEGSTERLSGREAGIVMTFLANRDFFVRFAKMIVSADKSANCNLANCWRHILCWQIVIRQIALREIATHPNYVFQLKKANTFTTNILK